MKLINKFKSPNFNERKLKKIEYIIIHYTALPTYVEALNHLCKKKNKVSSHFLISQDGSIYCLVDENKRAWHAGLSFWNSNSDMNSISLGIELDYSYSKINNKFSKAMMHSLIQLLKYLKNKYNISDTNILGHSDIAPLRKKDPGPCFPWKDLLKSKIIFNPSKDINFNLNLIEKWFSKNNYKSKKKISIFILNFIGYDTENFDDYIIFKKIIRVYQQRFIQENISGNLDKYTLNYMMKHFFNLVLTDSKKKIQGN